MLYAADFSTEAVRLHGFCCIVLLYIRQLSLAYRALCLRCDECRSELIGDAGLTVLPLPAGALKQPTTRCLCEDILHHGVADGLALCALQCLADLGEVHLANGADAVENGVKLGLREALVFDGREGSLGSRHRLLLLHLEGGRGCSQDSLNFGERCSLIDLPTVSDALSLTSSPDCLSLCEGEIAQTYWLDVADALTGILAKATAPLSLSLRRGLRCRKCNCT